MNLNQLIYFVAVVDEGSFTRAARRLLIAQPSLSHQIRALEQELGGPLLERLPRSIRLTPAGRVFLPEARAAVLASERARRAARMANELQAGEIEIATVLSIAIGLLPRFIKVWHESRPGIIVRLREFRDRGLMEEQVREGASDIAIGPRPSNWKGPVEELGYEQFVVILPENDPLAGARDPLALELLADRTWVLPDPGATLSHLVHAACVDAGFVPTAAVHTSQVEAAARLAAAGLGPTMLPESVIPPDLASSAHLLARPVARLLVAYTRSEWMPLAQEFLSVLASEQWKAKPLNGLVF